MMAATAVVVVQVMEVVKVVEKVVVGAERSLGAGAERC